MTEPGPTVGVEPAPGSADAESRPLAGWGRRLAAYLLDGVFSTLVGSVAGALVGGVYHTVLHGRGRGQ
ncbi:MAG TPA: hypothetical protein VG079_07410, partial [Gaiellaceae bacterium]|nr:hypothetical protein [Gaiellaceae bacterium]